IHIGFQSAADGSTTHIGLQPAAKSSTTSRYLVNRTNLGTGTFLRFSAAKEKSRSPSTALPKIPIWSGSAAGLSNMHHCRRQVNSSLPDSLQARDHAAKFQTLQSRLHADVFAAEFSAR